MQECVCVQYVFSAYVRTYVVLISTYMVTLYFYMEMILYIRLVLRVSMETCVYVRTYIHKSRAQVAHSVSCCIAVQLLQFTLSGVNTLVVKW